MSISNLPKPGNRVEFPEELDPLKKGREYCLQMCKAMYWYNWNISNARNAFGNPRRNDWVENRSWADGNPNMAKFVPYVSGLKDASGRATSYLNFDLKPICVIPKLRDIVIGYIEKLEYKVSANAVNPEAISEKNEQKWRLWVAKKLEGWLQAQEAVAGMQLMERPEFDFDFTTKKELDLIYDLTQKALHELEIEVGNEVVLNESDWKSMKRMLLEDLFDNGACCVETYTESFTGRVRHRYVDLCNLIFPHWEFRGHYLETPSKIGYVSMITLAQLRTEAGNQLTEEEYFEIAKRFQNQFGNGSITVPYTTVMQYVNTDSMYNYWYSFNIPVMTLYWEETDRYKYKREMGSDGQFYVKPVAFDEPIGVKEYEVKSNGQSFKKEKEVFPQDIHLYYMSKWIPNTDFIYNYGKTPNQARNPRNPKKAMCPMKLIRPANKSLLERCLPFEENNIIAWLKFQNATAQAIPSGFSLNIASLKNASIDGKNFPIKHQVELYSQTGRLVWSSEDPLDETGKPYPHPIQNMQSSWFNDVQAWLSILESNINKMRTVTGINEFMDSSTPDPKAAVGTAKLAFSGAVNSLNPIVYGITKTQEEICMDATQKLQLAIKFGGYELYSDALGTVLTQHMELSPEIQQYRYAIKIEALPTEQEKNEIKEVAKTAVMNVADPAQGGLYYSDYLYICHMLNANTNLRIIEAWMSYRIKRNLEQIRATAQQNTEMQAQAQQQAIMAQKQAEMEGMQMASQLEIQNYAQKKQIDAQFEQVKSATRTENQIAVQNVKARNKTNETSLEAALGLR